MNGKTLTTDERWDLIDKISKATISYGKRLYTLKDAVGELTVKPLSGIPIAIAILFGFWSVFGSFAGTLFTDGFFCKFFDNYWLVWMKGLFSFLGEHSWLYFILVGDPAADNCFEAFGVLTSGLFVPFGVVLPAIFIFYLTLSLLEDTGYLPRLAVLIDTVLHKIGLHGYAIVPTILAFGCNVPAVMATRILETKKQRFLMMALLATFIPCGAQLGIMEAAIPNIMGWIVLYLIIGYFVFGFIINKIIPGRSPEILIDVPPYQMPTLSNTMGKVWRRLMGFLTKAIPFVMLGCIVVGVLYITGAMAWLANTLEPIFVGWFGVPKETVGPLIAAFLRKDLAVAQLSSIEMTKYQMITAVVLVSIYFPCLATFVMMLYEGWKHLLGALAVLIAAAFIWGGLIHLIWILAGVQ
jgi:ferrous iron transport protein B